jgi:PAS domain S-box-containing protein
VGRNQRLRLLLPLIVLVVGGVLSLWLWKAATEGFNSHFRRLLTNSATLHASLISNDLITFDGSLLRIVRRWNTLAGTPQDLWREDAVARRAYAGATAVERLDTEMRVRWHVSAGREVFDLNEQADLSAAEVERLTVARQNRALVAGDVHRDASGSAYVNLYGPLFISDHFDGYAALKIDLNVLLTSLTQKTGTSNILQILYEDAVILTVGGERAASAAPELVGNAPTGIHGLVMTVRVQPTANFLSINGAAIPKFLLIIGLIFTVLAALMTYLWARVAAAAADVQLAHGHATEQARRYRELLRRAGLGFIVTDADGNIREANEPSLRMAGAAQPEDFVGHSIYEFLPAGGTRPIGEAAHASGAVQDEAVLVQNGGKQILLSANTIIDEAPDGAIQLISLLEDVTERTRTQQEIMESKRVYEEVFESADVAINDSDMSGMFARLQELRSEGVSDLAAYLDEDAGRLVQLCRLMKVNTMNRAGMRLFGIESIEQLREMEYFLQTGRPAQVREFALAIWNNITGLRKEVEYISLTGANISLIYSLRMPRTVEEARRVPIVVLEVTDVRSAESARQASLAKSQFLASMSHEIRTPLNGVIGNLELLAQTELVAEQEELLFDAEKAAKSLLALIGNILDFSKIEAGKLTIENVELNPAAIVQESVDIVQSRARQKGTYITSFIAPDVPEVVKGDPTRIRQILLNLLGNSVKFTAQGGVHLNLRVKDWDGSICQLLYTVHDSGHGFDQSTAGKLFQPFTQDTKRPTEDFGGTGLGLSICKSLVDTFGGEIACEGVRGEGATFWFTIPVQVIKPAAAPVVPNLTDRSVLFVNTDPTGLARHLTEYLTQRGANIITAEDEDAALAMCRKAMSDERHIDLAIYLVKRNQWPTSSLADALRECNTVPMVFGPDLSAATWRKALRSGASYLIPDNVDAAFFDRNIHQAFGGLPNQATRDGAREGAGLLDTSLLTGRHVLVLEDRLVNQTIIQRQLRKLGMTCSIAGDGIIGLEKLAAGGYDLILCDCSMPNMNGYEFTRVVREQEAEGGQQRIPIIAMTANAFREDREKCFAAGMDDFVSKPVTLHRLASVLTNWIAKKENASRPAAAPSAPAREKAATNSEAIDLAILHELIGSTDHKIISDIIAEFLTAAQESWRDVQDCVTRGDPREISKAAHGAKGEARNVGAGRLGNLYEELERAASKRRLEGMDLILRGIPNELQRVQLFATDLAARAAQ